MSRRAFSLVEMIVVMAILIAMMSILMPAIGGARDAANGTLCASHIRSLTQGFLLFAQDHGGHLPGTSQNIWSDPNPDHLDWLFGSYAEYAVIVSGSLASGLSPSIDDQRAQLAQAPQYGTLWRYLNNTSYSTTNLPGGSYITYRCPSLTATFSGGGAGSNGRFDYAAFAMFDGASIGKMPSRSVMHSTFDPQSTANPYPASPDPRWISHCWSTYSTALPTPLVCQEDAQYNINGSAMDGSHAGEDQLAHLHHGGSFYGSVDGSVTWVNEPDSDPLMHWYEGAHLWEAVPPSGHTAIQLDTDPGKWNAWAGN